MGEDGEMLAYVEPGAGSAGIQLTLILVLAAVLLVVLAGLVLFIRGVYGRSCQACGRRVKRGLTVCPHCDTDFAAR